MSHNLKSTPSIHPYLQVLTKIAKSPSFIIYVVCLLLLSFGLVTTYHTRPFTSDDVFWQTILLNGWRPFDGTTVTMGNSSLYFDKIPYFSFFNQLFDPSRKILFAQAALSAITGFSAFYIASLYLLKKIGARLSYATLLPFVWLTSIGYTLSNLYLNPNWRGFQLGVSFATFALVVAICTGDLKLKSRFAKLLLLIITAFLGLQLYSDPYFLYFTVGPIVLLVISLFLVKKIERRPLIVIGSGVVLTLIFAKLFGALSAASGVRTSLNYPMQFIEYDKLAKSLLGSIESILEIFNANFFGLEVAGFDSAVALLNFCIIGFAFYKCRVFVVRLITPDQKGILVKNVWPAFLVGVGALVLITYAISTLADGVSTYRYLLLLQLLLVLLLAMSIGTTQKVWLRNLLVLILLVSSVANVATTALGQRDADRPEVLSNKGNALNYSLIELVKSEGYTKGYANFWQANISTYLSGGDVSFLPSLCAGTETQKFHWLLNDGAFDTKADKSFYLIDPDINAPATCPTENILDQFGEPSKTSTYGNKTILFYNYDITPKLADFTFN